MGLFDLYRSDSGDQMTPHLAFATSLIYMMGADGKIDNEEVGQLLTVLGGEEKNGAIGVGANNQKLLDSAVRYVRANPVDKFLSEAAPLLSDAQRICVLLNLLDSSLSNGQAEPEEQVMFDKFMKAFEVTEERFRPFFQVLVLKHDRSIFTKADHPNNSPSHQVKLSV